MSQFNYSGAGNPVNVPSPGDTLVNYFDTLNNVLWLSSGNGWNPFAGGSVSRATLLALVANNANVSTYAVPTSGLYDVNLYEVSTNAPTGATLPAMTVTYTGADTGAVVTLTLAAVAAVSAANVVNQGVFTVNAKAGTNIVVATTGYVAGSGTALSYNAKTNITYLG